MLDCPGHVPKPKSMQMSLQAAPTVAFYCTVGRPMPLMPLSSLQVHDVKAESKLDASLDNTEAKSIFQSVSS